MKVRGNGARRAAVTACLYGVCIGAPVLALAQAPRPGDAESRYREQRALCESGLSPQDRATCLQEAGAALQAARRGQLSSGDGTDRYRRNALSRCERLPADYREACVARMSGEGTVRGSVEEGGIYRELTVREALPAPGSTAPGTPASTPSPAQVRPVSPRDARETGAGLAPAGAPGSSVAPGSAAGRPGEPSRPGASAPGTREAMPPGTGIPPRPAIPPPGTMPPRDTMTPPGTPRPPLPGVRPSTPVPGDRGAVQPLPPQPVTPREPLPQDSLERQTAPSGAAPLEQSFPDPRQRERLRLETAPPSERRAY